MQHADDFRSGPERPALHGPCPIFAVDILKAISMLEDIAWMRAMSRGMPLQQPSGSWQPSGSCSWLGEAPGPCTNGLYHGVATEAGSEGQSGWSATVKAAKAKVPKVKAYHGIATGAGSESSASMTGTCGSQSPETAQTAQMAGSQKAADDSGQKGGKFRVFVKNVPPRTTMKKISAAINSMGLDGTYAHIHMPTRAGKHGIVYNRGYARVHFDSFEFAERFINASHGQMLIPGGTAPLEVRWSTDETDGTLQ